MTDEQVVECFEEFVLPHVIKDYGEDDEIAIRTAFNDYTDMLCKDGEISDEQYNDMENPY
jgi:hypothetical protein